MVKPAKADPAFKAALRLHREGKISDAAAAYERLLKLRPSHVSSLSNLAMIMRQRGEFAKAIELYERALRQAPENGTTWSNLASLYVTLGRVSDAVAAARRATQLAPMLPAAFDNLGYSLFLADSFEEAERALLRAVGLSPEFANAWNNLGNVYLRQSRLAEAADAYQHAVALAPALTMAFSNFLFCMHFGSQWKTQEIFDAHVEWGRRFGKVVKALPRPAVRRAGRPRVGFVSPDLFKHPVAAFLRPLIRHWPHDRFELAFFSSVRKTDDTTTWFKQQADYFQDIYSDNDEAAARKIADWQADILIDIAGHTGLNRLGILPWRPAPVQINWLGYFDTTGMTCVDYLIADPVCVPPELERFFTERVLRLPDDFACFEPPFDSPEPSPLPALTNGYVTFGSQNQLAKITDEVIALWARLLCSQPTSRFIFQAKPFGDASAREKYAALFSQRGVDPSRIDFLPSMPQAGVLENYRNMDIALDPFPCAGGTTTCESLWMGVPVVTLIGDRFGGRHSASHLAAAGLPQLITTDSIQYLAIARRLATDLPALASLRGGLRAQMQASPLCDGPRYAAHFSALLESILTEQIDLSPVHRQSENVVAPYRSNLLPSPKSVVSIPGLETVTKLHLSGDIAAAERGYRELIAVDARDHVALANLAVICRATGRRDEAFGLLKSALAIQPDFAEANNNLGNVLRDFGRMEEAVASYRRAIATAPDYLEAVNNLGTALREIGRPGDAEALFRRALEIKPDHAQAHNNLGAAQQDQGKYRHAVASYSRAIEIRPEFADAHNNLGTALRRRGDLGAADSSYRRALAIRPDYAVAYSNLLFLHGYHAISGPQEYLDLARGWEGACLSAQERQTARQRKFRRQHLLARRLRVGYVSGDFRQHAISYFVERLFASRDRNRVELFAYPTTGVRDKVSERLEALADHWVPLLGLTDASARDRIDADAIDVLIDLCGHTSRSRLKVFALRAAPVQCHYLGYFASTGLTEMDYWIGDPILTPPQFDADFQERIWRLPRVWVSYDGKADAPIPGRRPVQDGGVWLGSFNDLGKLTPETLTLWARVMQALPEGRLLLKTRGLADDGIRQRVLDAFLGHGISADRIELIDRSVTPDWQIHMACYNRLDVALDPVGAMGGGTTTCDALWMGLPVVALVGDRMATRMTGSMLAAIDCTEWVAQTSEQYIDKVVALARDPERRNGLRMRQREHMAQSPLCDTIGLAQALESAFCEMFERWIQAQGE